MGSAKGITPVKLNRHKKEWKMCKVFAPYAAYTAIGIYLFSLKY